MLHQALKSVRKFHDKTVQETATELGVSISYISEIENGKKRIHQDILEGYSRVFELPISSFFLIAESEQNHSGGKKAAVAKKIANIIKWITSD